MQQRSFLAVYTLVLLSFAGTAGCSHTAPVATPEGIISPSLAAVAPGRVDPVWETEHGKRFHRWGCRELEHHNPHRVGRSEAIARGGKPCQVCTP
jgi:hypothetical protein